MRFDLDPATPDLSYKLLTACVTPRPIAWITTQSETGLVNAAPYSFFNAMGHTPPTVAIGILADPEKGYKDTARNILERGEFVVNLVPEALAGQMNLTCMNAPSEVSEIDIAALDVAQSHSVTPPRIAASPVSFECTLHTRVDTSAQSAIIIGQVQVIHVADPYVLDAQRCHIDTAALGLIGRMHGSGWYSRTSDQFQLDRPEYKNWRK